ncbi:MAG TPA: (d)CMP kinase [Caulobacteraceae bacterium]
MGFVVAIDGPAASGKGTIAARLGLALGLPVLDTGLLYRAVGVMVLRAHGDLDDEAAAAEAARAIDVETLGAPALRGGDAAEAASRIAVHPAVRQALLDFQRAFAMRAEGAILDGRDIGTVVTPDAPAKLYVTASLEARARRRWNELASEDCGPTFDEILADIERRDERDSDRANAPLRPAPDAVLLDTTDLSIDRAFDAARRIVEAARARWERSRRA